MELTQIPKIELHLHLDGAVPPETMWRMAQEKGLALPADTLEDFRAWLVRTADCRDVNTYLARFASADKGTHGFSRGQNDVWRRYPRWRATARLPRLPCQPPFILREKLRRTCRPVWSVVCKAEDAGLLTQVKDDNAADGGPVRPASACALVS